MDAPGIFVITFNELKEIGKKAELIKGSAVLVDESDQVLFSPQYLLLFTKPKVVIGLSATMGGIKGFK